MAITKPLARFFLFSAILALSGCAAMPIESLQNGRPLLDPVRYFAGHTHSWGVVETPSGQPESFLATQTTGHLVDGALRFEQEIQFSSGRTEHRSWIVRREDAHHFTATGTGIIGVARGSAYGNVFHLVFTLDALPGNPLAHVRMSQWMYLQADGKTLVNRDTITKAGLMLAQISEQFAKDR